MQDKKYGFHKDVFLKDFRIEESALRFIGIIKQICDGSIEVEDEGVSVNVSISSGTVKPDVMKVGDKVRIYAYVTINREENMYYIIAEIVKNINTIDLERYRKIKKLIREFI